MKNIKAIKSILAVVFIMALSFGVRAQDKYEYATVTQLGFGSMKGTVAISSENKYEEIDTKVNQGSFLKNIVPAIIVVNKMSQEGWEVYNNSADGGYIYYFLRKKKN